MAEPQVVMEFASPEALEQEFEENLRLGGAFVAGAADLAAGASCELVLVHPTDGAKLALRARVVWVAREQADPGVGVQLEGFSTELRAELSAFIRKHATPATPADKPTPRPLRHERIRRLSGLEQIKLAREGNLSDRVMLERLYGKTVWEALLRNPRLTPPEVARLARMGTLPVPLLEQIVQNGSWLSNAQVRRTLLSNRRLGRDLVTKVLRATPKAELKLVPKQTSYPLTVRQAAKRMLHN